MKLNVKIKGYIARHKIRVAKKKGKLPIGSSKLFRAVLKAGLSD